MDNLNGDLNDLNERIEELEVQIANAKSEAEENIMPLEAELKQVKQDKSRYGAKNDFDCVQECRRKEENLKFKISSQWNRYSILKNTLAELKKQKTDLENKIQLKRDRIRRNEAIKSQMNLVLENYRKTQNLRQAAIDAHISPDSAEQWLEWGKNDFNETYSYFYTKKLEIDDEFKDLEAQKLKDDMDRVADAYSKTGSLKRAAEIAHVSSDTVEYWYDWGMRGFGEENTYFYKKIMSMKK